MMSQFRLFSVVLAFGLALAGYPGFPGPAQAGGGKASAQGEGAGGQDGKQEGEDSELTVKLPPLVAPVVEDGQLVTYLYIDMYLVAESNAWELRANIPFIQDAFITELHRNPVRFLPNTRAADTEALKRQLLQAAKNAKVGGVESLNFERVAETLF